MFKATLKPESGPIMQQADVQSDGRFEFNGVIEGDYTMILAPVGPFSSSNIPVIDPLPIAVNGHDVDDLSVRVSPVILGRVVVDDGSALPLQVRDDPSKASALVRIHAEPMIAGEALSARPRADGAFLWPALTGEYQVAATLLPFGYSIKSISYGSVDLSNNVLKIDAKAPLAELRVTLTASPLPGAGGAVVRGRLVFDEQPRPGSILLQRRDSSSAQRVGVAEARADGTFEIRNVPAGVYALDVLPFGARTQFVTVEEGGSSVYLEVHIDDFDGKPYAGATGRVYDRTGKPAANMRVRYEGRNSTGRYETQTNSAGVYSLDGLLPGDYTVSILEEGRSVLAREVILLIALTSTNDFDLRELTLGRPGVQPR
jgi:hypothetical protein